MAGLMRLPRLLLVLTVSAAIGFAAACSKSDTAPSSGASSCTVTLGSVTTNVGGGASTGTLPVTAASSCAWTAASSASFLTITSGSTGTGNGTVAYSFAANTGAERSASITVNGTTVVFAQAPPVLVAPTTCAVALSATTAKANSGGGTTNITVNAPSNCQWTATSNASFLTVTGATTGTGTAAITATANGGAARTGTVTIGGQTVTVTQDPGIFAAFNLFDPSQTTNTTNVCQFRGAAGTNTTCTLRSTSFTGGANGIASYAWTIQYTYGSVKVISATSSVPDISFTDACGVANGGASDEGVLQPLDVTLTVTDSFGNTATAKSGSGSQPAFFVQLFNCGK
jgi:hypothetical protein